MGRVDEFLKSHPEPDFQARQVVLPNPSSHPAAGGPSAFRPKAPFFLYANPQYVKAVERGGPDVPPALHIYPASAADNDRIQDACTALIDIIEESEAKSEALLQEVSVTIGDDPAGLKAGCSNPSS